MRFNVVTFPGSNCDHDGFHIARTRGHEADFVWHKDTSLKNPDVVILPGGFSYGDYLRAGALAKLSPIIKEVIKFAEKGGLVIGICNGFQILTESGLLPGALMMNENLKFICQHQYIHTETNRTPFTTNIPVGTVLDIPIAHKEGNYYIDDDGLKRLQDNDQIVFRYCNEDGKIDREFNPNGAVYNIAGICNIKGNVLGMMPHPERSAEDVVISSDGSKIFESIELYLNQL
ncbi:MAG: phosphoribosylformylglycinamidine synthase I [Candidatus Cloacimonetes bacterium]|nr:phosphoribosylformylglycinamidine synthase I [Candidatus Cloacimonadota bacterium]